jgi:hypothetical protein
LNFILSLNFLKSLFVPHVSFLLPHLHLPSSKITKILNIIKNVLRIDKQQNLHMLKNNFPHLASFLSPSRRMKYTNLSQPLISWFCQEPRCISLGSHIVQSYVLPDSQSLHLEPEPHAPSYLKGKHKCVFISKSRKYSSKCRNKYCPQTIKLARAHLEYQRKAVKLYYR